MGLPVSQQGPEPDEVRGGCAIVVVAEGTSLGELAWLIEDAGVALMAELVEDGVEALGMVSCVDEKTNREPKCRGINTHDSLEPLVCSKADSFCSFLTWLCFIGAHSQIINHSSVAITLLQNKLETVQSLAGQ